VLLDPIYNALSVSASAEVNGWERLVFSPPFQSWVALDCYACDLVTGRINFSQNNVRVIEELFRSLLKLWSQGLAVAAPWSIELHQHFLLVV
jgi:hypothetical protein